MALKYKNGSLLDANVEYMCHQVNCQGRMRSGIAKAIREKWPKVFDAYMRKFIEEEKALDEIVGGREDAPDVSDILLGQIQVIPVEDNKNVINMFAQQYYGYDGLRYTSYDAFWSCLGKIREQVPKGSKIGFPWSIGCGLGGAHWAVIEAMIDAALNDDYEVYIYCLEDVNNA